jgi:hypothetical protein
MDPVDQVGYSYNVYDDQPDLPQVQVAPLPAPPVQEEGNAIYAQSRSRNAAARFFGLSRLTGSRRENRDADSERSSRSSRFFSRHRHSDANERRPSAAPVLNSSVASTQGSNSEAAEALQSEHSYGYSYDSDDSNDFGGRGTLTPPPDRNAEGFLNTRGMENFFTLKDIRGEDIGFIDNASTCMISCLPLNKETNYVVVLRESENSSTLSNGFFDFLQLLHEINTSHNPKHPLTRVPMDLDNIYELAIRII